MHFCNAYIFQRKMFSCAKMHLMRTFCYTKCYKCIFATHHILRSKMFSITFSFGKCSAPTKCKGTAKAEKCCVFCFAKNKDAEHFPKGKCSAKSKKTKHSKKERQCKNVSLQLVKCTYTLRRLIICKKCNVKFSYRSVKSSI